LKEVFGATVNGMKVFIAYYGLEDQYPVCTLYEQINEHVEKVLSQYDYSVTGLFMVFGKNGSCFFRVSHISGGSGYGEDFFELKSDGKVKEVLHLDLWHGQIFFEDVDGDGVAEIVTGKRPYGNPKEFEKIAENRDDYDGINPIIFNYDIYKWDKNKFKKLNTYYSLTATFNW
jgi:hypothetical protein